ncbi:MAG: hypothetical protein ABW221_23510 [Vicinamibacteria bacterium]
MTDLQEAAQLALQEVRMLRERLGAALDECTQASGEVAQLGERLAGERSALRDASDELGQAVEDATQRLTDEMNAAAPAVAEVAEGCRETGRQGQHQLQAAASSLDGAAQHLRAIGPQLGAIADTAESASHAALERAAAIAEALEDAIDGAVQLSEDIASAFDDLGSALEDTFVAVLAVLRDQVPPILREKETEFESRTGEVRAAADRLLPDMAAHVDEVSEYSLQRLDALVEETTSDLLQGPVQALLDDLENATRTAAARSADVAGASDAVVARQAADAEAARRLETALQGVRAGWSTLGF